MSLDDNNLTLNGVRINGNAGNDTLEFLDTIAGSSLLGGQGDDTFNIGAAISSLFNGNIGDDELNIEGVSSNSSFFGGQDDDTFVIDASTTNSLISGDLGDDEITVGAFSVAGSTLNGGDGEDTIDAELATSSVTIDGGDDDDELQGSDFVDTISGGDGDDDITGGDEADILTGGADADTFLQVAGNSFAASATTAAALTGGAAITFTFDDGVDVVTDFASASGDVLNINGTLTALLTSSGTTIVATHTALFRGNFDATTDTFVTSASGADILAGTSGAHTADAAITTSLLGANSIVLDGAASGFVAGSTII